MPKFKIVVECSSISIRAKEIEAEDIVSARKLAGEQNWSDGSWEEIDTSSADEIREDLCEEVNDGNEQKRN